MALANADTETGARGARNVAPDAGFEAGRAKSDEVDNCVTSARTGSVADARCRTLPRLELENGRAGTDFA